MRCAPRASNGPNHLGLCALQWALDTLQMYFPPLAYVLPTGGDVIQTTGAFTVLSPELNMSAAFPTFNITGPDPSPVQDAVEAAAAGPGALSFVRRQPYSSLPLLEVPLILPLPFLASLLLSHHQRSSPSDPQRTVLGLCVDRSKHGPSSA